MSKRIVFLTDDQTNKDTNISVFFIYICNLSGWYPVRRRGRRGRRESGGKLVDLVDLDGYQKRPDVDAKVLRWYLN